MRRSHGIHVRMPVRRRDRVSCRRHMCKCKKRNAKNAKKGKERNAKYCKGKKAKERKVKEGKECKGMQWKGMQGNGMERREMQMHSMHPPEVLPYPSARARLKRPTPADVERERGDEFSALPVWAL